MNTRTMMMMMTLGVVLVGCGAPPDPADDPACRADAAEPDFTVVGRQGTPVAGTQYFISTTYIRLRPGEEVKAKFSKLNGPIIGSLSTTEGLVSWEFSSSEKCRSARTLLAWKDEASIYKFVGSKVHAAAMPATTELSRGGSKTGHFTGTVDDLTWEKVFQNLGDEKPSLD